MDLLEGMVNNRSLLLFSQFSVVLRPSRCTKKTWKAIRHKGSAVENELQHLEDNTAITDDICMLLDMVTSILDTNGAYCCRCNKSLSRKERKQCNGCNRMTYCSIACQKDDWVNGGHKLSCCKLYTYETAGQFQGRVLPATMLESDVRAAAKLKELEINVAMIQLKLLLDNAETILSQVSALDIPLYDIVVIFDLRGYPLKGVVKEYTEYYSTLEAAKGFEDSRSKDNITCV